MQYFPKTTSTRTGNAVFAHGSISPDESFGVAMRAKPSPLPSVFVLLTHFDLPFAVLPFGTTLKFVRAADLR